MNFIMTSTRLEPERMVIDDNFKMSTYRGTVIKKFEKEYNVKLGTQIKVVMLFTQTYLCT